MCHILEQDSLVKYIISFLFFFFKGFKTFGMGKHPE